MSAACAQCGAALDAPGTFHPALFCAIKKAWPDQDPWEVFASAARGLGVDLPDRAPLVRDLPVVRPGHKGEPA